MIQFIKKKIKAFAIHIVRRSALNNKKMKELKKMKVLDVQWGTPKMPEDVKRYFFDYFEACNDVWVEYEVGISSEVLEEGEYSILDKWLMSNTNVEEGEEILLKHWW